MKVLPASRNYSFKNLILLKDVLHLAYLRTAALRKKRRKMTRSVFDNHAARFMAYGQFIFWIHNYHLGQSVRKILPTCVYTAIRKKYPSADGTYSEFKASQNIDIFID